jgi:acid-sensing ion channel, other
MNLYQPKQGFHFIVHSPDEFPSDSSEHFYNFWMYMDIRIEPELTFVGGNLKSASSERRNCLYNHESQLRFFQVYSKQNCEHECQSLEFEQQCGCVPFYMLS